MSGRMYAEALPVAQPAEWYGPESRTNAGPGLGTCSACTHQTHAAVCGYRAVAADGNGVAVCWCEMGEKA